MVTFAVIALKNLVEAVAEAHGSVGVLTDAADDFASGSVEGVTDGEALTDLELGTAETGVGL